MKQISIATTVEELTALFSKAAKVIENVPPRAKAKAFEMAVVRLEVKKHIARNNNKSTESNNNSQNSGVSKKKKTIGLNGNVLKLIEDGYFNSEKSPSDLYESFKKKALTYTRKAISVALMRLVRKNLLTRNGDGSSKNPWTYLKN